MALPPATAAEAEEEQEAKTIAFPGGATPLAAVPAGTTPLAAVPGGATPLAAVPACPRPVASVPGGALPLPAVPAPAGPRPLASVPGGPPPLATVPGGTPSHAATPDAAAGPDAWAPTDGGDFEAGVSLAVIDGGASEKQGRLRLYSAALRVLECYKGWATQHQPSVDVFHESFGCIGSRFWEQSPVPDASIVGINPLDFFGLHPVWEGFAVPVKRTVKTNHFFCTFCKKVFCGNANKAYLHMMTKSCIISKQSRELLHRKERVFSQRKSDFKSRKGNHEAENTKQVDTEKQVAKMIMDLSCTTLAEDGVLSFSCLLLEEAERLIECGIKPHNISEGYEEACQISVNYLKQMSARLKLSTPNIDNLVQVCMTALPLKMNNNSKQMLAEIAVQAVLAVADLERNTVNLNLVKVEGKVGGKLEDTELIFGIAVGVGQPEVTIEIVDAKIAIVAFNFEAPAPLTNHKYGIVESFRMLHEQERKYFVGMIQKCKVVGAALVIFQWGFDKDVNFLFIDRNLPAIKCVDQVDLELIAAATGGKIIERLQDLCPGNLGKAGLVRNKSFGIKDQTLYIEQCSNSRVVTIFVRGGNESMVQEVQHALSGALSVARNIFQYTSTLYGDKSTSCMVALEAAADRYPAAKQGVIRSFANALDAVSVGLTQNNGVPSSNMTRVKAQELKEHNPHRNIHCKDACTNKNEVLETLIGKKLQQIILGTQVVKKVLNISLNVKEASNEEGTNQGGKAAEDDSKSTRSTKITANK